uniref:Reverse transcriptase domain-containing protein n=1 Tax=Tanacetum cinerariifolium TaxID=118510 RepID=A0A699HPZ9_TANCI|nr:hypothetical protein [Tanacetum cinerariifolium]
MPPKKTPTPMTNAAIKQLIDQGVFDALAEHEANRNSKNRDDRHDSGSGERRQVPTTRECTYNDFPKCQPFKFKNVMENTKENDDRQVVTPQTGF